SNSSIARHAISAQPRCCARLRSKRFEPFERFERSECWRSLLPLRRQRTDEITVGKVSDGFAGFGEGSCHLAAGINPHDCEVGRSNVYKPMRLLRGNECRIKRM